MKSRGTETELTIGEVAGRFGLATHVLRHWEAMGVLDPGGRVNGRRRYGSEHLRRVAFVLRAKEAGLSLRQIHALLSAPSGHARRHLLREHHAELERRIAEMRAAQAMIEHVLRCTAPDFMRCRNFQRMLTDAVPPAG